MSPLQIAMSPRAATAYSSLVTAIECLNPLDADYIEEEFERILEELCSDHRQPWLRRYSAVVDGEHIFLVIISTSSQVDDDAALGWVDTPSGPVVTGVWPRYRG